MKPIFLEARSRWREYADSLRQPIANWVVKPQALVELQEDAAAWQGITVLPRSTALPPQLLLAPGESVILDFGEHLVGQVEFSIGNAGQDYDCPVVLRLLAAETPYELTYRREEYKSDFAPGWMQEEVLRLIHPGERVRVPNRLALRYLRIDVRCAPGQAVISNLQLTAQSSAGSELPEAPPSLDDREQEIYRISCRTLRNCMQGIFEDGPKRDRRLWLGDLRLQALVNAVTFRNADLVKRSLYLLASDTDDDGTVASCTYENARCGQGCRIMEYPLLLAPTLLEHLKFYDDLATVRELYPLAEWQFSRFTRLLDDRNLLLHDNSRWLVIDHSCELEKNTAFQGMFIFCLEALAELAQRLGHDNRAMLSQCEAMRNALRQHCLDAATGFFASGDSRQLSVASQVWAVLGKAVTGPEARTLLERTVADKSLLPVCSPYMQHYLLEACHLCGAFGLLRSIIREYWGAMTDTGASTFYEVFRPDLPLYSPYGDAMANSACHAWSCTPAYYQELLCRGSR